MNITVDSVSLLSYILPYFNKVENCYHYKFSLQLLRMNSFGAHHLIPNLSKEEDLPLDKVLKHRQTGKKLPEQFSSQSENGKEEDLVKKNKPILKEQKDIKPKQIKEQKDSIIQQVSSTDLVKQLILNQQLTIKQAQNLMIRLKNIKSLKYDKLTERIRENLIEVRFKNSYQSFVKIISGYTKELGSTHLIHAIFHGFELAWRWEKFESVEFYEDFLRLYLEQVPCCLNKRFAKWMKERMMVSVNRSIYSEMRHNISQFVRGVIFRSNRRSNSPQNEKIISLVVYFELWDTIDMKQLVKIVPLEKINEYIDNDQAIRQSVKLDSNKIRRKMEIEKEKDRGQENDRRVSSQQQESSVSQSRQKIHHSHLSPPPAPPLVHLSIIQLLKKNNLKQVEKILKSHKISHLLYPDFVHKLQMKYLQYAQRTNPIYVIDELVHGKVNLVEGLIDIYLKKRKFDHAEHFMHKYKLRNVSQTDPKRIFVNPLKYQDAFGPTESHVLNQRSENHFFRLLDFDVPKSNVVWIDSVTIFQKQYTTHLKKLIFATQVGLDSESSSAIHVFDKARLEIIQIYEPESNVVLLFDVRDFKTDKKKRNRKQSPNETLKKQHNLQKPSIQKETQQIDLQQIDIKDNKNLEDQNKAWYRFTKVIENVFKNATIFGHVLHSDLGEIISGLNLNNKANKLKIRDSQTEFKKYYPNETKSRLSFLAEKCFGKEISKFEQCGAWDMRPLRNAQKHYAALDAVLPYKLVKWMQEKFPVSKAD